MRGNGDAGEVKVASPVMRRWWRSMGFWLGLWGLGFLVWAWVDSHSNATELSSYVQVESASGLQCGYWQWQVRLLEGRAVLYRERPFDMSPGLSMKVAPPEFAHRALTHWRGEPALWGRETWIDGTVEYGADHMSVEGTERWCSFGFVVLGYAVVWLGLLVMWRWWMRRRWRAAQAVVG